MLGKKILRSLLIAVLITGISVILIGCSIALPTFDASKLNVEYKTTTVYDRNDKPIAQFQAVPGEPAKLIDVPDNLKKALVDVEDSRFYQHNGIDFRSIGRAVYTDILTGSKAEGGSTLTQQLAKNVYLSQEKTMVRKFKEIYLAAQIERNFSKDDILEMYLNRVYFGHGAFGVKAAAEVYFGKGQDMKKLTLAQCAMLAGLPNAPSAYDPLVPGNEELAYERRKIVLEAMFKNGDITEAQLKQAENEKFDLQSGTNVKGLNNSYQYPYYMDYVFQEAEEKLDIPAEQIMRGGVKVYTNLDQDMQKAMEDAYKNPNNFPDNAPDGTWVQGASVIVDSKTGGITALVGGRDKDDNHVQRGFNRVSQGLRSPGSSVKPIVDYGPAIDTGFINTSTQLNNQRKDFGAGYNPANWNGQYSKNVSVQYALDLSLNVPAVHLLQDMGIDVGYKYAKDNFGLPLKPEDSQRLGIAIGDMTVTPLDMAGAYTAFANNGVRSTPYAIREVRNADDTVIASVAPKTTQAIKENTAKIMTKLMLGVVNDAGATGNSARIPGRQVAGKTGSTEMEGIASGDRDFWFAGYTPDYVMVNWMGFDKTDNNHYLSGLSGVTAKLFSTVMSQALEGKPKSSFDTTAKEQPAKSDQDKKQQDAQKAMINDLKVELSGNTAQVSWSPVPVDGVKYFLYRAELQTAGQPVKSNGGVELSAPGYTDNSLVAGKTYYYSVVVMKDGQKLSESRVISLTVPGAATPDQPQSPTQPTQPQQPGQGGQPTPPTPPTQNQGGGTTPGGTGDQGQGGTGNQNQG
ncbi:MAG: PBP1A family penicillin-binding protein, partial [Tumebacillaceae bacterium]